jgi:hypothetical protein
VLDSEDLEIREMVFYYYLGRKLKNIGQYLKLLATKHLWSCEQDKEVS